MFRAGLSVLTLVLSAARLDAADCAAAQLDALGLPGNDKAAVYRASNPELSLPELTDRSRALWCRVLGLVHPDLQAYWPAQQGDVVLTRDDPQGARKALLAQSVELMRRRFMDDWGAPISTRIAVIGAADEAGLNALLAEARTQTGQSGAARLEAERFCGRTRPGAFAGRGVIGLCWPSGDAAVGLGDVLPSVAHEMMHHLQYELVPPGRRADGDRVLGPGWMIEGAAEVIEAQSMGLHPQIDGAQLFNMQMPARRSRVLLSELERSDSVREREAYAVSRFAAFLLARKHGTEALIAYFDKLGRSGDRDQAFEDVFGQSFAAFEADFERVRRDFAAAEAFGRDAD